MLAKDPLNMGSWSVAAFLVDGSCKLVWVAVVVGSHPEREQATAGGPRTTLVFVRPSSADDAVVVQISRA